jgi:hypothetical protein
VIPTYFENNNSQSQQSQSSSLLSAAMSTLSAVTASSENENFKSTGENNVDTHSLALGLGLFFGCLAICCLGGLLFHQKRAKKNRDSASSSIGVFFTEEARCYDENEAKQNIIAPSVSRRTSATLLPSINCHNNNIIGTRWNANSFLGVVASVVAEVPSHYRSSTQQYPGDIHYPDIQFLPRVSSHYAHYMKLPEWLLSYK